MNTNHFHQQFLASSQPHILMLTVHGIHEWDVVPGLKDTGGQNVFVNQFSSALAKKDFKVTIINRGGYQHPRSGVMKSGLEYRDSQQRILYLTDGLDSFVRKEDMQDRLPELVRSLSSFLDAESSPVDLIISHYWDGGKLGYLLRNDLGLEVKHVWVPHSLGLVKQRNLPSETWKDLRILERIENEKKIFQQVDFVAATSSIIQESAAADYQYSGKFLWLPPCIDQNRYHSRDVGEENPIWHLLGDLTSQPEEDIREKKIILEISRTDRTKQKDILIEAFARLRKKHPDSILVISIDRSGSPLGKELVDLINSLGIGQDVAVVGSIWELLPILYAVTDVYCTPSIMEGFGMSVQEAAATGIPVISSDLVPFVTEYLAGRTDFIQLDSGTQITVGEGAVIVPPGNIEGFAYALDMLLSDDELRQQMGQWAFQATVPYFTWDHIVQDFIKEIDLVD